jgi:DNA-binding beta-propeller fold protein YncE
MGDGVRGDRPGQFDCPSGVAFSRVQEVYVCDALNHRVQVFGPNHKFSRMWDVPQARVPVDPRNDAHQHLHTFPVGIAVAPWEEVYVIKKNPAHVYVFDLEGGFRRTWKYTHDKEAAPHPVGVDVTSTGQVVLCDRVQLFKPDGTFLRSWTVLDRPEGLCVAPNGHIYVVSKTKCHVYDQCGNDVAAWDGLADAFGIAISRTDEVFVAEAKGVRVFDARGVFKRRCGLTENAPWVAVSSERVYIGRLDGCMIETVPMQ